MKNIKVTPSILIAAYKQEIDELEIDNKALDTENRALLLKIENLENNTSKLRYSLYRIREEMKQFQSRFSYREEKNPWDKFAHNVAVVVQDLKLRIMDIIDEHKVSNDS